MANLVTPPLLRGSEQQQLTELRDYLFQLHRQLGTAITAVEEGNFSTAAAQRISERATEATGSASAASKAELSNQVATLKSLIIKTADLVEATEDRIEARLQSSYVAKSDFGDYMENNSTRISIDGKGISEVFDNVATLNTDVGNLGTASENLATNVGGLNQYVTETQGYIRQGVIGYREDEMTPIIGIAIGQDIQTTKITQGGEEVDKTVNVNGRNYVEIDTSSAMSTFSAEKLSFYLSGTEVAYVSNNKLFIAEAEITGALTLGSWEISHTNGLSIKWVGA